MSGRFPSVVIVGRPNVGKSTFFNRLTGTRRSIVTDEPGITRDRIYGAAEWEGKLFEVVDTGGIVPEERAGIPAEILRQARIAIANAAVVILVTDARTGPVPLDLELAQLLRRTGKRFIIAANKIDSQKQLPLAAPFYELAEKVFPLSAEHGAGIDDLLDFVTADFSNHNPQEERSGEINIAIVGRPNVGKSTLLNRMAGEERSIVSPEPGTTRDAVDTVVERNGKTYRFLDTAGIRRKGKTKLVAEKLSVVMARRHLERADVALLVIDGTLGVTSHDATIAAYTQQSGSALIVVVNKWDLALKAAQERADEEKKNKSAAHINPMKLMADYEEIIRGKLKFIDYAPIIFLSAFTGERTGGLYSLIDRVIASRERRVSTGEMNRWLSTVDLDRGTSPAENKIKIYYVTQASTAPPTFVLFTNQKRRLHFGYERFLENRLRERFDFTGTPIRFQQRVKQRRRRSAAGFREA